MKKSLFLVGKHPYIHSFSSYRKLEVDNFLEYLNSPPPSRKLGRHAYASWLNDMPSKRGGGSPPCRGETKAYRTCLRERRSGGRRCEKLAKVLETCREKWRRDNNVKLSFDGTRVLPNKKCRLLNEKVQHCLAWRKGVERLCRNEIELLKSCMSQTEGVVAQPTATDKIWADFKAGGGKN